MTTFSLSSNITSAALALPLLKVQHIGKSYDQKRVLEDIHFDISEGEIVTIIGPNGCGKTTLVKIIMGLLEPDEGQVWKKQGIHISYIPQKFSINPLLPMTVRRFLSLAVSEKVVDNHPLIEELGLTKIFDVQAHRISGGELQRVLLARAMLQSPQLLILDEPMQGIDISGQLEFYRMLAEIKVMQKVSILMISHDLHMVMKATDRVICINHHICCEGTPEDVTNHPSYVELFGHSALRTLAIYSHHHDHTHIHEPHEGLDSSTKGCKH